MSDNHFRNNDVAVIMTCHNRREKTMQCLDSLFKCNHDITVYLTDDGCNDGTCESVITKYPYVNIIKGDGNLFWNQGMYVAWKEALKGDHQYYLWVNDDILLKEGFLEELLACEKISEGRCIISGIIADSKNGEIIYGGYNKNKTPIKPTGVPQEITFMNGNLVLISKNVVQSIGILDPKFHHDLGDIDYGLTAQENGIKVYTTRKVVAHGYANDYCRIRKWGTKLTNRFRALNSPLGSPINTNYYFRKKHFGFPHAIMYCAHIIILNLIPDWMIVMFGLNKYAK